MTGNHIIVDSPHYWRDHSIVDRQKIADQARRIEQLEAELAAPRPIDIDIPLAIAAFASGFVLAHVVGVLI